MDATKCNGNLWFNGGKHESVPSGNRGKIEEKFIYGEPNDQENVYRV